LPSGTPGPAQQVAQLFLFAALGVEPPQQPAHVWNHWEPPDFPVLRAGYRVALDGDFPLGKITVPSKNSSRFALVTTAVGKELRQIRTGIAEAPPPADRMN